jgi:tetratricopeptide (TPR) repeat protein
MVTIEVKLWLFLTVFLIWLPFIWLFYKVFYFFWKKFFSLFKRYLYKKNLENLKRELSQINNGRKNNSNGDLMQRKISPKIQHKLERIKVQALVLKEKGDLEWYEKKLIEWLSYDPENIEFLWMLGDLYFSLWKYNKALPLLKKILEKDINNDKIIWQIGKIYFEKGDLDTAKLLVEKAIRLKPKNPKYYVTLAEIFYNQENLGKAIQVMETCVKLRPGNINYLLAVADLYEQFGDIKSAKRYYFKVLEYEPTNDLAKEKLNILGE